MPLPRDFNFAAHLFAANARPRRQARLRRRSRHADLRRARGRARAVSPPALRALGLRREERVLLLMLDSNEWPVVLPRLPLRRHRAGLRQHAAHRRRLRLHARAQPGAGRARLGRAAAGAAPRARARSRTSCARSSSCGPTDALHGQRARLRRARSPRSTAGRRAAPTHGDDAAFWLYSSGSTGKPKGTVHTHANLWWTAELYGKPVLGLTESDVCFSAAKLYFAYGLGNALTFPLSVGATVVLMAERPTPDAVFKRWTAADATLRPTVFFGAPTGFAGMLASPALPARDAVRLRMCSSAGEALPSEIGERFERHFGCRDHRRHRLDRDAAHLHLEPARRRALRHDRQAGRRLRDRAARRRRPRRSADGEVGDLYIQRPERGD